jgi:hypothetical protein
MGDPDTIAKRLMQRAHNRDGLPEIAVGLTFLVVAAFSYAQVLLPRESIAFKAAVIALALLIPVLSMGAPWALKRVRRQYLIERVGYLEPKSISRRHIVIGTTIAVMAALVTLGFMTESSQSDRWVLAGTGLLGGALAALSGQLPRFVVGGVLMAATGIVVASAGVSLPAGFAILFGFAGLLALVSGGVVFLRFVRQPIERGE